ncbi:MAG: serine/threonine-protein kinase [Bacteroidota bacterium]
MTRARWIALEDAFERIDALPATEQAAAMADLRERDPVLHADLAALRDSYAAEPNFLETAFAGLPPPPARPQTGYAPGDQIGVYGIVRLLGEGGMGSVYLVEREAPYQQQAALKVLRVRPGRDMAQRFHAERQILATLTHPHIARLLDGGTTPEGQPYFVMAYVEGVSITQYAQQHRLGLDARLRLFQAVCQAVAYAHRNLVVHRDLKPTNILVDGEGTVKLLDFGIAKLLAPTAGALTVETGRLMTPGYAAPEQIKGEAITTATDVYALGVLLYELLTDQRLLDPAAHPAEAARHICEAPPTRPSTAITGTPEHLPYTAPALRKTLRGDLDTMVLHALNKDPERRYASADQFHDDVARYLGGLPLSAQPDSVGYRLRKFAGRHRAGVAAAAAFVLLLTAASLALALQASQLRATTSEALQAQAEAEQVSALLIDVFRAADPNVAQGAAPTARELLDRGREKVAAELDDQPATRAQLLAVLSDVYDALGAPGDALPMAEEVLALRRRLASADADADVATALNRLGWLHHQRGDHATADSILNEALAMRRAVLRSDDPRIGRTLNDLGVVNQSLERLDRTAAYIEEALSIRRAHYGPTHRAVGVTLNNLAALYWGQGDYAKAERAFRESLVVLDAEDGARSPRYAVALHNIGTALLMQEAYDQAEGAYRQALAIRMAVLEPGHKNLADTQYGLGNLYSRMGRLREADSLLTAAVATYRAGHGDAFGPAAHALLSLAKVRTQRHSADALDVHQEAYAAAQAAFGATHRETVTAGLQLAKALPAAEAQAFLRNLLALLDAAGSTDAARVQAALDDLSASI